MSLRIGRTSYEIAKIIKVHARPAIFHIWNPYVVTVEHKKQWWDIVWGGSGTMIPIPRDTAEDRHVFDSSSVVREVVRNCQKLGVQVRDDVPAYM